VCYLNVTGDTGTILKYYTTRVLQYYNTTVLVLHLIVYVSHCIRVLGATQVHHRKIRKVVAVR
jgi:hypothetical protein